MYCFIMLGENVFVIALCYADDIVKLSNEPEKLQEMIDIFLSCSSGENGGCSAV